MAKKFTLILVFICVAFVSNATHIVGGSLTYVYNGGNVYTITLKLYKDCGPGTAGLPGNVVISVVGNNGVPFIPSKDITINLGTVTNLTSNLDPCAIPPNPVPCVQEAIYTRTVSLPPNSGGYHMYFQIVARNGSLSNVVNALNTGESFYAFIPGTIQSSLWNEDFTLPNGTTVDAGTTAWTTLTGSTPPTSAGVNGNDFEVSGDNNASYRWTSQIINIAGCNTVAATVNLAELGSMDANDSILVYYRLNGGALTLFPVNGFRADDFTSTIASVGGLVGTSLQIVIRTKFDANSPNSEVYQFDDINVQCHTGAFIANSNPVFNLFPPLFICVNQPFTFNHAATDIDGDSLAYSLYTPYNGENGVGPLDPIFPSNTASFTPIVYPAGYSTTSPLGSPVNLNVNTGLLTGTPNQIGQFVVGVLVKEYRNGVYIGQTLRDFQFNVLNCPQPPPAITVTNISINNGCVKPLVASGIIAASAVWNSIAPGAPGAFNNFLSCTSGCLSPTVIPVGTPPAFVDYVVCGTSLSCAGNFVCDTVRVTFNSTLGVNIQPSNPTLCFGQTSTTLTAVGFGGTPPYSYLWNNVNTTQSIFVGVGTYNVQLSDASGCPPAFNTIVVSSYSLPIAANAGPNITRCIQNPIATINATVTGAVGGIWSGGNGTYSPNNTTLSNFNYIPSAAELAAGSVTLTLTSTGNGSCPVSTDQVVINYSNFTATASTSTTPISCFGGSNGLSTVNLVGGTGPFSYTWSSVPTQTTATASNLALGVYSVSIKDGIGCVLQTTIAITQPTSPLSVSSTATNVSCQGGNNGAIQTTITGGTSPYTYSWLNNGQTGSGQINATAGIYTLVVSDSKSCTTTATIAISQPSLLVTTLTTTNVSCFNGTTGSINSTVTGGTSPYTYSWSPSGSSSTNLINISAGSYTLTVTDNKGCVSTRTATITQPLALTAVMSFTNETCNYLNNGIASVTASGGAGGFTYSWTPGAQTTTSVSNLTTGTYSVLVTDINGCNTTTVVTISEPPQIGVTLSNQLNVSCAGGNNATASANGTGGTPNYTYSWSPGGSTNAINTGMTAGVYTVVVKDTKLCLTQATLTITQPTSLTVTSGITNITCNSGNNGAISINPSGGVGPYTSVLFPGNVSNTNFASLSPGNYSVVTTDANGCNTTITVTINQPINLSTAISVTNSSCGLQNGIASISITSGGLPPFTYQWLPSGGTNSVTTNLMAGAYTVNVTDANGCVTSNIVLINDINGPNVNIASNTNVSCFGGANATAVANFVGGTGPAFTYSWSPSGGSALTATNLAVGQYVIKITDSNGCIGLATTSLISQPTAISTVLTHTNALCFGGSTGIANAIASGGTPGYTYSWSPGGNITSNVTGLLAGTYTLVVNDNNNCIQTSTLAIGQPSLLTVSAASLSNVSCFGGSNGSATVSVTGGTLPIGYNWLPYGGNGNVASGFVNGSYTLNVSDANGCTTNTVISITQPTLALSGTTTSNPALCFGSANGTASVTTVGGTPVYNYTWSPSGGNASTASGLANGNYLVTIKDLNNCQTTVPVIVSQATPITASLVPTNASCGLANGFITSQVSGGTGAYSYSWNAGLSVAANLTSISAGTYTLVVTDANSCAKTLTSSIVNLPAPAMGAISSTSISCFGGSNGVATATVINAALPYTITWSPAGGTNLVASNLAAGNYSIQLTDGIGCVVSASVAINQPTLLSVSSVSVTDVSCFGQSTGSVSLQAVGGSPAYSYSWSPNVSSGSNATNLAIGSYTVIVKDINNCSTVVSATVNQPTAITSTISNIVNALCYQTTGSSTVSVSGGTIPYTYNWSSTPPQTGSTASGLLAGNYIVQATDAKGCVVSKTVTITQPSQIVTSAGLNDTICTGQQATISASAIGGVGNYYYVWNPSGTINNGTLTPSPTTNSTYTVVGFDQNGCAGVGTTVKVIVYDLVSANISVYGISPICPGEASVISGQVFGNTGPVNLSWNNGLGSGTGPFVTTPTQATTYVLTVTSSCGLSIKDSVTVLVNPQPTMSLTASSFTSCAPGTVKFTDFSVAGNSSDPITSWNWTFGDGTVSTLQNPSHVFNISGTYTVSLTVSTDAGCTSNSASTPITINAYASPIASFSVNSTNLDLPYDVLYCTNTSTGAVSYNWNFGDGGGSSAFSPNHLYQTVGQYTVQLIVANQYGCTDTAYRKITTRADVIFPNAFTPNPDGGSGGSYTIGSLDNDVFFPYTSGVTQFSLQIYDRWGELIFESKDVKNGWDGYYKGKICQMGVYIWKASVKLNDGKEFSKSGDLTLLR